MNNHLIPLILGICAVQIILFMLWISTLDEMRKTSKRLTAMLNDIARNGIPQPVQTNIKKVVERGMPAISEETWALQRECIPSMQVGIRVEDSGYGPGVLTGVTAAGFPKVSGVAVSWAIFQDGSVFDPYYQREGPRPRLRTSSQKGFTLIELMIVIAMIGMVAALLVPVMSGKGSSLSWGVNGLAEERCIAGYAHVVGERGQARQILSARGTGIPCDEKDPK